MRSTLFPYCVLTILWIQSALSSPIESSNPSSLSDPSLSFNYHGQAAYFHSTLERALLNNSNVLYQLQQIFFPTKDHLNVARLPFSVSILVDSVLSPNNQTESNTPFNCSTVCRWSNVPVDWYPELSADLYSDDLRQYVLSIHEKLKELDYVSWSVLQLLAAFGEKEDHHPLVSFTLIVPTMKALPSREDASQALLSVMAWVKAYARAGSDHSVERSDQDKGDVFLSSRKYDSYLELCILILFVSINVFLTLMAGVFLKSFSSFLVKKATAILKESTRMLSLYWATALVFTATNIGCFMADLYAFQYTLGDSLEHNILYAKLFLIVFVLLSEPFIVYYTTRHFSIILNVPDKVVHALCCCFSNVYGSRFAHTIAVLNILWFTHRVITALIIILFHIVVSPAETFTTVTLIFSVIIISILLTSYVLLTCNAPRKKLSVKTVCRVFCAVVTGTLAAAVVVSFSLVYLAFLDNGLHSNGVGGFLLSLLPPFTFFMIGLIVQKKFLRKKETDKSREDEEIAVSPATGNVTKIAEYQLSEAERAVGRGRVKGRGMSLDNNAEDKVNRHRKSGVEETSRLVEVNS